MQQKLINLILQTCQGNSRQYSRELLAHFVGEEKKEEKKDFRKQLKSFLTKLNEVYSFSVEEKNAFHRSCKILEKENRPSCCRIF